MSLASAIGPVPSAGRTRTLTVAVAGMFAATGSIVTEPVTPDARTWYSEPVMTPSSSSVLPFGLRNVLQRTGQALGVEDR